MANIEGQGETPGVAENTGPCVSLSPQKNKNQGLMVNIEGNGETPGEGEKTRPTRSFYSCQYCDKTYLTSQALGGHQNCHRKEREAEKKARQAAKLQESQPQPQTISPFVLQNLYYPNPFAPSPYSYYNPNGAPWFDPRFAPSSSYEYGVPPSREEMQWTMMNMQGNHLPNNGVPMWPQPLVANPGVAGSVPAQNMNPPADINSELPLGDMNQGLNGEIENGNESDIDLTLHL